MDTTLPIPADTRSILSCLETASLSCSAVGPLPLTSLGSAPRTFREAAHLSFGPGTRFGRSRTRPVRRVCALVVVSDDDGFQWGSDAYGAVTRTRFAPQVDVCHAPRLSGRSRAAAHQREARPQAASAALRTCPRQVAPVAPVLGPATSEAATTLASRPELRCHSSHAPCGPPTLHRFVSAIGVPTGRDRSELSIGRLPRLLDTRIGTRDVHGCTGRDVVPGETLYRERRCTGRDVFCLRTGTGVVPTREERPFVPGGTFRTTRQTIARRVVAGCGGAAYAFSRWEGDCGLRSALLDIAGRPSIRALGWPALRQSYFCRGVPLYAHTRSPRVPRTSIATHDGMRRATDFRSVPSAWRPATQLAPLSVFDGSSAVAADSSASTSVDHAFTAAFSRLTVPDHPLTVILDSPPVLAAVPLLPTIADSISDPSSDSPLAPAVAFPLVPDLDLPPAVYVDLPLALASDSSPLSSRSMLCVSHDARAECTSCMPQSRPLHPPLRCHSASTPVVRCDTCIKRAVMSSWGHPTQLCSTSSAVPRPVTAAWTDSRCREWRRHSRRATPRREGDLSPRAPPFFSLDYSAFSPWSPPPFILPASSPLALVHSSSSARAGSQPRRAHPSPPPVLLPSVYSPSPTIRRSSLVFLTSPPPASLLPPPSTADAFLAPTLESPTTSTFDLSLRLAASDDSFAALSAPEIPVSVDRSTRLQSEVPSPTTADLPRPSPAVRSPLDEERYVCEATPHTPPHDAALVASPRRGHATEMERRGSARFICFWFRRVREICPDWSPGAPIPSLRRPAVHARCRYGQNLAQESEFAEQRRLADECLGWMREHVVLLTKLESGRAPVVVDLFCGAGGSSCGIRRMGCVPYGVDIHDMPEYRERFGTDWFEVSDALNRERLRAIDRRHRPLGYVASPPCEGSTTTTFAGALSEAEHLIAATRDALEETGRLYGIENVMGARSEIRAHAVVLRGASFGLRTDRPRYIEAGGGGRGADAFQVPTSALLQSSGKRLRARCCLGNRGRFPKLDGFGRRSPVPCCCGNIFSVIGDTPAFGSVEQNARAMGMDPGHMSFARMRKALPPAYISYVVGQMAMHRLRTYYGLPVVSFDVMRRSPARHVGLLRHWRRGAGGASPSMGLSMVGGPTDRAIAVCDAAPGPSVVEDTFSDETLSASVGAPAAALDVDAARELDYTFAGGHERALLMDGATDLLSDVRAVRPVAWPLRAEQLLGANTLIRIGAERAPECAEALRSAIGADVPNTRITVVCLASDICAWSPALSGSVVSRAMAWHYESGTPTMLESAYDERADVVALSVGWRVVPAGSVRISHAELALQMDPRDRGIGCEPKARKAAISYTPMPIVDADRWETAGFPARVVRIMRSGVEIDDTDLDFTELECDAGGRPLAPAPPVPETGQYAFRDAEYFQHGCAECDRAIIAGHLEAVPAHLVEWALSQSPAHPWTVVLQHGDKWRSCQDYSVHTNARVPSRPFTLPSIDDARRVIGSESHFGKYDLRDGFWLVPVARSSRHHLMVRHPATGRLLWCRSLPFGFKLSPFVFCDITECIAAVFRLRVAGKGIYIYAFVDDFLIIGDTRDLTAEGMAVFETLLEELGAPWAAHKLRGPARVIEFLGHLLSNAAGRRCIALTESRQIRMEERVESWLERAPVPGETATSEPRELAVLLGHLVFCCEVVPLGRTYMQAMLRQFAGLEVDWTRGRVRWAGTLSEWRLVSLSDGFFRDLVWWRSALARANCTPIEVAPSGEAAITGTDASDWGCGELVWVDGAREECVLRFTRAERRRPINFRELRGCLRILEVYGERLSGRTILLECDNSTSVRVGLGLFSRAEDMQELVRRIVEIATRFGITVRLMHTPGAALTRPDATSRGAAVEEPRVRFSAEAFDVLQRRFGRFDSFLGAERHHPPSGSASDDGQRRWMHPTFGTVASALRMLCSGMRPGGDASHGLVVVPWSPAAQWWSMVKHFTVVARYDVGSRHLHEYWLGVWRPVSARRASIVLAFPRSAGAVAMPLTVLRAPAPLAVVDGESEARARSSRLLRDMSISVEQPLPIGSLLYSPVQLDASPDERSADGGDAGCLYRTVEVYTGAGRPRCAWLRRQAGRGRVRDAVYLLERGRSTDAGGSFFTTSGEAWQPVTFELWLVNHHDVTPRLSRGAGDGAGRRLVFDYQAAEAEIAFMRTRFTQAAMSLSGASDVAAPALARDLDALPALGDAGDCESSGDDDAVDALGVQSPPAASLVQFAAEPPQETRTSAEIRAATEAAVLADDDAVEPMSRLFLHRPAAPSRSEEPVSPAASDASSGGGTPSRPSPVARRASQRTRLSVTGRELVRNTADGMLCAGCGLRLGRSMVCPGGDAMIHDSSVCDRLARARLAQRAIDEAAAEAVSAGDPAVGGDATGPTSPAPAAAEAQAERHEPKQAPARTGSDQRRNQLGEQLSEARRSMVQRCLDGRCGVTTEVPMTCMGPGRGAPECGAVLHGVACAQFSRGIASLGRFRCARCRLRRAMPRVVDYPEEAISRAIGTMLIEMRGGAEATGQGWAEYARLESLFVASLGALCDEVVSPRDDAEVFKMFLEWLVVSKERALSLQTIYRTAGAVMARTRDADLTRLPDVSAFYRVLKESHGEEGSPRTAVTRRIVRLMLEEIMPARLSARCLARDLLVVALQVMMGLRIGETVSGGDFHGVLANHLAILTNLATGVVSCELLLEHSKTKFKRIINAMGLSEGAARVRLADYIRGYWAHTGLDIVERKEGGYMVESPDYSVLRVGLMGMTIPEFERMGRVLSRSASSEVRRHAAYSIQRGGGRLRAAGSMDKRYINVAGGASGCEAIATASLELTRAGFGQFTSLQPGPLIRATHGDSLIAHMPLQASSTYDSLHKLLDEAYERTMADPSDPDPEIDLQGREAPQWGHHSFRRFADTVARTTRGETGATEQDIDIIFGWLEAMYSHKMQLHYETKFLRELRCCVTRLV